MKILIACEESQTVCKAFRKKGHEAFSCDILPCSGGHPEWYLQGDVLEQLDKGWDMMIAHPPCTRLCNSGVMWLEKRNLWKDMEEATTFFNKLLNAKIPKICVENPIPHKYGIKTKYSQLIQPWQFGHGETKATCLWLKNLPLLKPTNIVSGREQRLHKLPPSKDRAFLRSKTFQGIADAMAEQWSSSSLDNPEKQKPFYVKTPLELDIEGNQIRYPLTDK